MKRVVSLFLLSGLVWGCSPLKNSPQEERYQVELTLHEVQTNVDDLRHDLQTFKSEWELMENKVSKQDNLSKEIKQLHMEGVKTKLDYLENQIMQMRKSLAAQEALQKDLSKDMEQLTTHANDVTTALTQQKERMHEIEKGTIAQSRKLEDLAKLKTTLEAVAQSIGVDSSYVVKKGDSLELIAKRNNVTIDELKKANGLKEDLIVIGQKLQIPKVR